MISQSQIVLNTKATTPKFLRDRMLASNSINDVSQAFDNFSDTEALKSAMTDTGEISNPWYQDWLSDLENTPKPERLPLLLEAAELSECHGDDISSKEQRTVLRFELRNETPLVTRNLYLESKSKDEEKPKSEIPQLFMRAVFVVILLLVLSYLFDYP